MAVDRVNAVHIGHAKDRFGFPCTVLEDPDTKAQLISYEPEVWEQRHRFLTHLHKLELRSDQPEADTVELIKEVERERQPQAGQHPGNGSKCATGNAWPGRPPGRPRNGQAH